MLILYPLASSRQCYTRGKIVMLILRFPIIPVDGGGYGDRILKAEFLVSRHI